MTSYGAVLYREDDAYIATCPVVETTSQGATMREALQNLKQATRLLLAETYEEHPESFAATFCLCEKEAAIAALKELAGSAKATERTKEELAAHAELLYAKEDALAELLEDIEPYGELDWGEPRGNEAW